MRGEGRGESFSIHMSSAARVSSSAAASPSYTGDSVKLVVCVSSCLGALYLRVAGFVGLVRGVIFRPRGRFTRGATEFAKQCNLLNSACFDV